MLVVGVKLNESYGRHVALSIKLSIISTFFEPFKVIRWWYLSVGRQRINQSKNPGLVGFFVRLN